jgi:hypothetical protein
MRVLLLFFTLLIAVNVFGQNCPEYPNLIKEGDNFFTQKEYRKALNKYNAAKRCLPAKSNEVDLKINSLFGGIEAEKNEAIKQKNEAEKSKELADTRLKQLSDLISNITDLIQDERTDGILGFTPLKIDLIDKLIPASEAITSTSKNTDNPLRSAEIHLQKGFAFEDMGKSFESEKEYGLAYSESYTLIRTLINNTENIPDKLSTIYLKALLFHTWNLITTGEYQEAKKIFNSAEMILPKINTLSAKLNNAMAGFSNVQGRYYSVVEKKDTLALQNNKNAVKFSRKAVEIDSLNIRYKLSLAQHLKNLSIETKFLSNEEINKLENEACSIYTNINSMPGNGGSAIKGIVDCQINQSFDSAKLNMDSLVIENLLQTCSTLGTLIYYNPYDKDNYIKRARIYTRLAQIEAWKKSNEAKTKFYLNLAVDDWVSNVGTGTNIQNLWEIKSCYENISRLMEFVIEGGSEPLIRSKEDKFIIHQKMLKALELNQKVYGSVPEIAKITTMGNQKLIEFRPIKNRQDTLIKLSYCDKVISAYEKLNLTNDFSNFDEVYASYCGAYDDKLSIYISLDDLDMARQSYKQMHDIFNPIYEKYKFDFYLGQHFWGSAMRMGKFLFEKGYINEAMPILNYASFNGISESTKLLAKINREGLMGRANVSVADSLDNLAKKQSMKKFTIPCDFGGKKYPFDVYVRELPRDYPYRAIEDQAEWLSQARGGNIPDVVRSSFIKLQDLAWKNDVSFPDLCVYALEAANEEKKKKTDSISAKSEGRTIEKTIDDKSVFNKNKVNVKYLTKTNDILKLKNYLIFYLREKDSLNAAIVRTRILKLSDNPQTREEIYRIYLEESEDGNFEFLFLSNTKKIKEYRDYFLSQKIDSISDNDLKRIHYVNLILLDNKYLEQSPKDSLIVIKYLSSHYNSLGWQCIMTKRFENTVRYIKKSIELNENNVYAYGNLPHAYLFTGQIEKAKELYLKWKDLPFDKEADYPTFKDAFLGDFKEFEKAGIRNENIKGIIELLNAK